MKLLLVAAILGCVAVCALGDSEDKPEHHDGPKCTHLQKIKIRRQWERAFGQGSQRLIFGVQVWSNIFKEFPKTREMFAEDRSDNVYSPKFQALSTRLFGVLNVVIETTDDPEALKELLTLTKAAYDAKGIKPEFYDLFIDEILRVLPEHVGNHFDFDAWKICLTEAFHAIS